MIAPRSEKIVKLHHLSLAVGFAGAETNGAENSGDIRGVVLFEFFLGQHVVIYQPFQAEHPDYIGFRFFQAAVGRADSFTNQALPAAVRAYAGPNPCAISCMMVHSR